MSPPPTTNFKHGLDAFPRLDPEKFLLAEYVHTLQEMARYDNDSTRLSQLLGLLIFGTSFFSSSANTQFLFAFLPFLSVLVGFLLASNQFAYAARERYVVEIEQMVAKFGNLGPRMYSVHTRSYWHSNRFTLNIFLPIRGAFLMINCLLLSVLIIGTWRTTYWLKSYDVFFAQVYLGTVAASLLWFFGSLHSGWQRLSQTHIKILDNQNSKLGKPWS